MNPNEPEVRNISEVTIINHGTGYSLEVWIGDDLVYLTPKLTYHPPRDADLEFMKGAFL